MENFMKNDGVSLYKKVRHRFIFSFVRGETCCLIKRKSQTLGIQGFSHTRKNTHSPTCALAHNVL